MIDRHPTDPLKFQEWVNELERKWLAGEISDPQGVAVIVCNPQREVLLQLRDNNPAIVYPNTWTLPGGVVDPGETPDQAARRELEEETGLSLTLSHWKVYPKQDPDFKPTILQHIYTGQTRSTVSEMILGEGQALRFFRSEEYRDLTIAFGFIVILNEYFQQFPEPG